MGHYKNWLREVLYLHEKVRHNCNQLTLKRIQEAEDFLGPVPADPCSVYGVKVRSFLSDYDAQNVRAILQGGSPEIETPRSVKRRLAKETADVDSNDSSAA